MKSLQKSQSKPLSKINLAFELEAQSKGYQLIAGVDEAGRGPLAGPVVAAACLFDPTVEIAGINDSKQLSPLARESLFNEILSRYKCSIGVVSHTVIDEMNILKATHRAMQLAVQNLPLSPDFIYVDGCPVPFDPIPSQSIVKGDERSVTIAAASIVAKVVRDRIMKRYHSLYPRYRYDKHMGYGTAEHRRLISEFGPSPIQRLSFNYTASLD